MSIEDDLRELLVTYPSGDYMIEAIEISHSLFSQTYYLTIEPLGITATLETAATVDFTGTNIEITRNSTKSDLDQNYSFTIPDLDNVLDDEMGRIPFSDSEDISVKYRAYLASDLTEPAMGPVNLQVVGVNQEKGVFTITAGAPQLNWNKTGIIYDYDTWPMLRALS